MKYINENDVVEKKLEGRFLRWIVGEDTGLQSDQCSSCIMRVMPGETVNPAHSHTNGEELIYVIEGNGRVYVDGIIKKIFQGSAVLFEKNTIHMVQNNSNDELKVACFFSMKTNLREYKFFPEINFDDGMQIDP